jgi:hypothetical protein
MEDYVAQPDEKVRVVVVKSENMGDWWTIERAEHKHERWMKPTEYGASLMYSGRISDACVEGTAMEMIEIAAAIENCTDVSFRRCAVSCTKDGCWFESPRNSQHPGYIHRDQALELAKDIRKKVAVPPITEQ